MMIRRSVILLSAFTVATVPVAATAAPAATAAAVNPAASLSLAPTARASAQGKHHSQLLGGGLLLTLVLGAGIAVAVAAVATDGFSSSN